MLRSRKLGGLFLASGALSCVIYLVPTVYGAAMSHLAVARFRAAPGTGRAWDSSRILAYQRTLGLALPPPVAVLRIPRLGVEVPVLEGVSDVVLNRGVGHIPGTALPGERGNLAITGHRDGFFRPLQHIAAGDIIFVDRPNGGPDHNPDGGSDHSPDRSPDHSPDRYVVRGTRTVFPSDTSVLKPTADSTLTLVTCFPFHYVGAAPQRFIVQASLISSTSPSSAAPHRTSGD